jgi:hypothetical protein
MTAIHLHFSSDVGTTYKRALLEIFSVGTETVQAVPVTLLRFGSGNSTMTASSHNEGLTMRKPRDFDAELRALNDKAKALQNRKVQQLGELVIATGADALTIEQLAGLLIAGTESKGNDAKESWGRRGAAFFQRSKRDGGSTPVNAAGAAPGEGGA